jgi:hypothetical protein
VLAGGGGSVTVAIILAACCVLTIVCTLSLRETSSDDLADEPHPAAATPAAR